MFISRNALSADVLLRRFLSRSNPNNPKQRTLLCFPNPSAYNSFVLQQLRNELAALKAWDAAVFACEERTELDAIAHRIIRVAEILRKMRKIVEQN